MKYNLLGIIMNKKLTKKEIEKIEKKLIRKDSLVYDIISNAEKDKVTQYCNEYKEFLDSTKTEREAVSYIKQIAEKCQFKNKFENNTKLYKINKEKNIALAYIGKQPLSSGINIIAVHVDAPRLDLKQNPLYEEINLALLKTHYYGGIRKYQWLARPLAIHGVIIKENGEKLNICIGESEDDMVFAIPDLLPHLAKKVQNNKKLIDAFKGEKLNILTGSIPLGDSKIKDRFKLNILKLLNEKYDILEEDLFCSELEIVPAGKSRDVGLDRSMVGGYGQDDRVCAWAALKAICELKTPPDKTSIVIFFDKEEIGSEGNTSAKSRFLNDFIFDLIHSQGFNTDDRLLGQILNNSKALSGDVNAAIDPDYQEVHEKRNAAKIGFGVCISKYTGHGGKVGSNDASAEFMSEIRQIFNKNKIIWQTGEIGKIDEGGGGTIAKYLANSGMDIIDCGTPVLSMHSPFEITSKADVYMTYKAYNAFFK